MKVVIQRVQSASVTVKGEIVGAIQNGLLIMVGFGIDETEEDMNWVANKIVNLRIFNDNKGVMNLSVKEVNAEILLVSQFTLMASTKKGNRPSYINAASPEEAKKDYENFIKILEKIFDKNLKLGIFGEDMKVNLLNDGPVTIIVDSKLKE